MDRYITLRIFSTGEVKQVSREEAERIIREVYADPLGGYAVNRQTGQVVSELGSDVEDLLIVDEIMGGG